IYTLSLHDALPILAFGKHGLLQVGRCPVAAGVAAHLYSGNPAAAAPGDSGDLPPTPVAERHRVRRERDDRLRVHHEAELARGAVGERISVLRRLLPRHEWAIRQLDPPD